MKLPYALFGVFGPPLTFTCPSHRRELNLTGIAWESKGNIGIKWADLVWKGVGIQHLVVPICGNTPLLGQTPEMFSHILCAGHTQ
jgi:hypothetical protein